MAEQLGKFVPLVGGGDRAVCLIELLGALATVEETVVRDKAVESANMVIAELSPDAVVRSVLPVVERLTRGDWFTARVSACGLFASTYARLRVASAETTEHRAALRRLFEFLCQDDTPMVRRAASKNIGPLAGSLEPEHVSSTLLPLFQGLASDDQDSVRLLAIENCAALAKILGEKDNQDVIMPLASACAEDKSWRVRNNVAEAFYDLSAAVGDKAATVNLLPYFVKLLQDPEAEVRASASKNVAGYCSLVGSSKFISDIVPCLRDLASDVAQAVRVSLAEAVVEVVGKLSKAEANTHLTPLLLLFLRPEEAPEVRLKVISSLNKIASAIGADVIGSRILPSLEALGGDQQWRVRQVILDQLPLLAATLGADVFNARLFPLFCDGLGDQVAEVRKTAAACIRPLSEQLGEAWVASSLVPKLRSMLGEAHSYIQRITVLYALASLAGSRASGSAMASMLPVVETGFKDVVPNVRFVAVRTALEIARHSRDASLASRARGGIEALRSDVDKDVKFFAIEAVASLDSA
jgi:serine/threonine-protein phosphatase 2A regulatory subunit A